jgi:hypothetical protein
VTRIRGNDDYSFAVGSGFIGSGFKVGSGFRVQGSGFRVQGWFSGSRVPGSVHGLVSG